MEIAPSPDSGSHRLSARAQTPPEQSEGRLIGPQRVLVKDLPAEPTVVPQGEEVRVIRRLAPDIGVRPTSGGAPQAAEVNVLDSAARQGLEPKAPPGVSAAFEGLDDNDNLAVTSFTITPPDPQIAVGPDHVVEFVNIVGRITDKSGALAVADFSLASFFGLSLGSSDFDPKIIYDDIHDRFFASYVSIDAFGDGFLHLAISETSDPTGAWNTYFAGPYAGEFPDYPGIGVTNDKFTISYNLFNTSTSLFVGEQTLVVEKADVMAGVPGGFVGVFFFAVNDSRFTVRPAHSLSAVNDQYLTTWDGFSFNQLTVIRITGTPNASNVAEASATNVTTLLQDSPPPSVTAGPGTIDSGDFRVLEAIWRDNSLWSSASAACIPPSDASVRSCAHLIEVETVGIPSVVQDIMFGASGEYFSWPAIGTDSAGNLYVSLTHSDPSVFAEARLAGRCATDALNTMSGSSVLRTGETVHLTGRWGDYLGAAVDPADPSVVWVLGEYAKNTGGPNTDLGYWGTYVAKTTYDACSIATATFNVSKDFSDDNTANVTVALVCTTGTVTVDDDTAKEKPTADTADFTANGFTVGATCTATETVPAGYTKDESGCVNVPISTGNCTIVNTLNREAFTGDWDGDGDDTLGWYRPSDQSWHLKNSYSSGPSDITFVFGGDATVIPVTGDWDGDGVETPGWYRPSDQSWHLRNDLNGGSCHICVVYGGGSSSNIPVVGDWVGDGDDTIGWYRPSDQSWHLRNDFNGGSCQICVVYGGGSSSNKPVTGDWDGDGDDTIGWYRPSDQSWHLRNDFNGGSCQICVVHGGGSSSNKPVSGDWDGDADDTIGWYRPSDQSWHLRNDFNSGSCHICFVY